MKSLKNLALTLTFALGSLTLMAQPQDRPDRNATPEERAEKQTEMMTEQLDLSKDQQKQVYAIILEFSEAQAEARKEGGQGEERGERGQGGPNSEAMKALDAKIAEVLTDDQKKAYAEMQEKRQEGRGPGGQGGQGGGQR